MLLFSFFFFPTIINDSSDFVNYISRILSRKESRKGKEYYRSIHREFFHINIDKYSALYLASKASAFLLDLFIYLLYNNRAINSNLEEKENYEKHRQLS